VAAGEGFTHGFNSGSCSNRERDHDPDDAWTCVVCGEPWPCRWARAWLLIRVDPIGLAEQMAACLEDASTAMPDTDVTVLWERFLGWMAPRAIAESHGRTRPKPGKGSPG